VECLLRPDAGRAGPGDFEEPYQQAAGLFETALTIPGIDRWPFDLAQVQVAYGAPLRRAPGPRQCHGRI
jgi:hypothetical protein